MLSSVPHNKGKVQESNPIQRPWQGTVLGILCLVAILLIVLFVGKLGYEGFEAGEMGNMIGIFAVISLIFLIPLVVLKAVVAIGIFRGKKWAIVLMLVFTILSILCSTLSLTLGFAVFLSIILYHGMLMWVEIICLKHPYYNRKN
jgi:hypothetical protein